MAKLTTAKSHLQARPTGTIGTLAAAAVLILKWCGVDISVDEAGIIIGGIVAVVSAFTPRVK